MSSEIKKTIIKKKKKQSGAFDSESEFKNKNCEKMLESILDVLSISELTNMVMNELENKKEKKSLKS